MVTTQGGPTFLGIGAPRCGTTWLHWQLSNHPKAWVPPYKELHFFDSSPDYTSPDTFAIKSPFARLAAFRFWNGNDYLKLRRTLAATLRGDFSAAWWWWKVLIGYYSDEFYREIFPRDVFSAIGEITPSYSILVPQDIQRIYDVNPDMKFVFMVRDPIDRIWSALRYNIGRGNLKIDAKDVESMIQHMRDQKGNDAARPMRGEYLTTLRNYLKVFPPENILIGFYDAIQQDPEGLLKDVGEFLGLDPSGFVSESAVVNASKVEGQIPEELRRFLLERERTLLKGVAENLGSYACLWSKEANVDNLYPTIRGDNALLADLR